MIAVREFEDPELGKIIVRTHSKARHIILRAREDAVYITVPPGYSEKELEGIIAKYRSRLIEKVNKTARRQIDLNYRIEADFFKLSLTGGNQEKFLAHSQLGIMTIVCPPTARFEDEELQQWLRKVIEESLRKNARITLAARLKELSEQHRLPFNSVKINASKGRWGSCSARKDINLSFYLLLLPGHLIDYVLLHELSHTIEMNHGEPFWKLLDQLTGGKALALRKELRKYKTAF